MLTSLFDGSVEYFRRDVTGTLGQHIEMGEIPAGGFGTILSSRGRFEDATGANHKTLVFA